MNIYQFFDKIREKCPEVLKTAWKPVQFESTGSTESTGSKFGGVEPFRCKTFQWPHCSCGIQMEFVCQINMQELPEQLQQHIQKRSGLFQFFYCELCKDEVEGCTDIFFVPEEDLFPSLKSLSSKCISENNLSTNALPDKLKSYVLRHNEVYQTAIILPREKKIKEWIELSGREVPGYTTHYLFGVQNDADRKHDVILTKTGITKDDLDEMWDEQEENPVEIFGPIVFPHYSGIKLAGYICGNRTNYPTCSDCQVEMTITFLQMGGERGLHRGSRKRGFYTDLSNWIGVATRSFVGHVTLFPRCGKPGFGWS